MNADRDLVPCAVVDSQKSAHLVAARDVGADDRLESIHAARSGRCSTWCQNSTDDRQWPTSSAIGIHAEIGIRSEEHTSELQSLMRISYAVFCLKNKNKYKDTRQIIKHKTYKQHTK